MPGVLLHCPIRGTLNVPEKAADGLTYSEEKRRIDSIRFLLAKGYPATHIKIETVLLRFGNKGRNSFRTDLAVLDTPISTLPHDIEILNPHIKLIAEIKRDNADAKVAKATQVYPALDFLHDISAFGMYWDDVEQRLFYRTLEDGTKTKFHETTISVLPLWGQAFHRRRLRCADLRSTNLLELFEKIEDRLHSEVTDKSRRFEIMLQLLLAPIHILGSKRDVVQGFYMYFARGVYKWDLAQYFTPSEVVDFIVTLVNPQAGDQVKDPACGSGDFLVSSFQYAEQHGGDLRDAVWGADNSENSVHVCVLNMVLNGDGKSNIQFTDSLANIKKDLASYSVMLCNPPFGTQILERRFEVLRSFDLGHEWKQVDGTIQPSAKVLEKQEVGLLFAEVCVKQAKPGGRIGIIMPNG